MRRTFRWSAAIYRVLLAVHPSDFRRRFGPDLEADFVQLLEEHGRVAGWRRALVDMVGSVPSTRAHARAVRRRVHPPHNHGEPPMRALLFDLRLAARGLLKAPVFTTVTTLTLALGIGANSAMFSLVNAALLKPLGVRDPDRLVFIYEGIPQADLPKMPGSVPDILEFEQYQRSYESVAAYRSNTMELSGLGDPRRIDVTRANARLFPLLGVDPMLGRVFRDDEDKPGQDLAVLSYPFWQANFLGNPEVVGTTIRLDRRSYTIVGIMPPTFQFPKRGPEENGDPADVWIPVAFTDYERKARGSMYNNSVIARLKPGVSLRQARAELDVLGPRIRDNYPAAIKNYYTLTLAAIPMREELTGQIRTPLLILFGAVGLVLLVACANVANLILSRAAAHQHELGLRVALGASYSRLFQYLICESLLLSISGGALGLIAGRAIVQALPSVLASSLPGLQGISLDSRVVGFTIAVSIATALIFGIVPLLTADRDISSRLHEGSRTMAGGRSRMLQRVLVTATVSLAVVLMVGASLLVRSFTALMSTDPGFRPGKVLTMTVSPPFEAYPSGPSLAKFVSALYQRLRTVPGVRGVSLSTDVPLESNEHRAMTADGGVSDSTPPSVAVTWLFGQYLETLGIPMRTGRSFSPEEDREMRPVAIVSESLQNHYWPGKGAVGKRIKWGLPTSKTPWFTIVGVVGDVKDGPLGSSPVMHVYVPYSHMAVELGESSQSGFGRSIRIALLANGDPASLVAPGRREIAALDASLPVTRIATMAQQVTDSIAPQSFSTTVLSAFALGALLLAAVGLYGVLAFAVTERRREIGVRIALGASRRAVLGMVVHQGMLLVVIGLAAGLAAAGALTRVMASLLYRTDPYDPWTFIGAPIVLACVGFIACYVPARRAAGVDPIVALRSE